MLLLLLLCCCCLDKTKLTRLLAIVLNGSFVSFVIAKWLSLCHYDRRNKWDISKYLNHDVVAIAADEKHAFGNSESFLDRPAAFIGGGQGVTDNLSGAAWEGPSQNWPFSLAEGSDVLLSTRATKPQTYRQHHPRIPRHTPLYDTIQNQCNTRLFQAYYPRFLRWATSKRCRYIVACLAEYKSKPGLASDEEQC